MTETSTQPVVPQASRKSVVHHAPIEFLKFGEGASKNFGFMRHMAIGMTLGLGLGFIWKSYHWNEKRFIAQYYADLSKKEARDQAERQAEIQAKFQALEEELLG